MNCYCLKLECELISTNASHSSLALTQRHYYSKKNLVNSKYDYEIQKKAFHYFVELIKSNPMMYKTLYFDKYSYLAMDLNIIMLSTNNSKIRI